MNINKLYNFDSRLMELAEQAEKNCAEAFVKIEKTAEYCGAKVLKAFSDNRISESCFYGSTGYGYGDIGREAIDKVFAQVLGTEDALVRFNFVSGTHALSYGQGKSNQRTVGAESPDILFRFLLLLPVFRSPLTDCGTPSDSSDDHPPPILSRRLPDSVLRSAQLLQQHKNVHGNLRVLFCP